MYPMSLYMMKSEETWLHFNNALMKIEEYTKKMDDLQTKNTNFKKKVLNWRWGRRHGTIPDTRITR